MAKRKTSKGVKDKGRLNRRKPRRDGRIPAVTRSAARSGVVTTGQIEAVLNVLNMLIDHADQVASKARLEVVAARDLLVSKGIVAEQEWDAAVDRVQRGRANLFALDPDAQRAVDELRRLLDPEGPNGGAPDEGGEA